MKPRRRILPPGVAVRLDPKSSEIIGLVVVAPAPKEPSLSMPAQVKRRPQDFSRNSTSSFRAAVRDALDLRPFPRKAK